MPRTAAAVFFLLAAGIAGCTQWLQPLDMRLADAQFKLLRAYVPRPVIQDVVVVGFNEATEGVLREPQTLWHRHFGKFLQAMAGAGASVVGVDVVLPERSFEQIVPGYDRSLLTGILIARRSTPTVLALTDDPAGNTRAIYPAFISAAGAGGTGYALLPIDGDGVVRRFDERIALDGKALPTLAGQMARKLGKPVGAGMIDFGRGAAFDFVPLETVLAWHDAGNLAQLARIFGGKPVLLGGVLRYEDRLAAPVNLVAWDPQASNVPGVVLHAQVLRNLLNEGLIRPVGAWMPFLLSLGVALPWLARTRPSTALWLLLATWFVCLAGSTFALAQGYALPVAGVMLVAVLAIAGRQVLDVALSLRERRRLRSAFGGYVSPGVMGEILSGKLKPAPGGEKQFACVLFSDIRGYTTLSEHLTPEQTIAFLNSYFERIVPIIHAHEGTVVSFMGDGIMAVFGAPNALANPCASAFQAAADMLADRHRMNLVLETEGKPPLQIGIGLHAGEGVAGHIGAAARHEYSMIGDVTNVASRLEGLTKDVGYRLVCSRTVVDRLGDRTGLVELGAREIRGHSPVEIFGYDAVA